MDWRDKDDDDLTAEDIDAMCAAGTTARVTGPPTHPLITVNGIPATYSVDDAAFIATSGVVR